MLLKRHISKWCNIGVGVHAPNRRRKAAHQIRRLSVWCNGGAFGGAAGCWCRGGVIGSTAGAVGTCGGSNPYTGRVSQLTPDLDQSRGTCLWLRDALWDIITSHSHLGLSRYHQISHMELPKAWASVPASAEVIGKEQNVDWLLIGQLCMWEEGKRVGGVWWLPHPQSWLPTPPSQPQKRPKKPTWVGVSLNKIRIDKKIEMI